MIRLQSESRIKTRDGCIYASLKVVEAPSTFSESKGLHSIFNIAIDV